MRCKFRNYYPEYIASRLIKCYYILFHACLQLLVECYLDSKLLVGFNSFTFCLLFGLLSLLKHGTYKTLPFMPRRRGQLKEKYLRKFYKRLQSKIFLCGFKMRINQKKRFQNDKCHEFAVKNLEMLLNSSSLNRII